MLKPTKLIALILSLTLAAGLFLPALAEGNTLYVNTPNHGRLNLRRTASPKGTVLTRISDGTPVTVLEVEGTWTKVKVGAVTGYVQTGYLANSAEKTNENGSDDQSGSDWTYVTEKKVVHTGNSGPLRLRRDPSLKAPILGTYRNGTEVTVTAHNNVWAKVTVNGKLGYMTRSKLADPAAAPAVEPEKESSSTPAASSVSSTMYVQNGSSGTVALRYEPENNSVTITRFPTGTPVQVVSVDQNWVQVSVQGLTGYMPARYLMTSNPLSVKGTATVVNPNGASYVNLRSKKTMSGEDTVLAHVKVDSEVSILRRDGSWYVVAYRDYVGYMHHSFISRN